MEIRFIRTCNRAWLVTITAHKPQNLTLGKLPMLGERSVLAFNSHTEQ